MDKVERARYHGVLETEGARAFSGVDIRSPLENGDMDEAVRRWSTAAEDALIGAACTIDPKYSQASYRGRGTLP
eukprot:14441898-Heterocapsa_arctica.AAC.1